MSTVLAYLRDSWKLNLISVIRYFFGSWTLTEDHPLPPPPSPLPPCTFLFWELSSLRSCRDAWAREPRWSSLIPSRVKSARITNPLTVSQPKQMHSRTKSRKLRRLKVLASEDTLLQTHCCRHKCFPVCPRAQHWLRTQILCPGHKKCFWFCSETFCGRNKCFPVCAAHETSWATTCPRLPVP